MVTPVTPADWREWYTEQKHRYTFGDYYPDDITYYTAHRRIKRMRGIAATYKCAGHSGRKCNKQAVDWSYDHNDPKPLITASGREYSDNTECYSPRCKACHQAVDRSPGDRISQQTYEQTV